MSERCRAFVGLPLPSLLEGGAASALEAAQRVATRLGIRAKWALSAQLHVTLKFLGDVSRRDVPLLVELVEQCAAETAPIASELLGVSVFGSSDRTRVLFLDVTDPDSVLSRTALRLDEAAQAFGVPRETRSFTPHVTLARLARPTDLSPLLASVHPARTTAHFDRIRLYESVVTREGGRYTVLADAPLTGPPRP